MTDPTITTAPVKEDWNEQRDKLKAQFPTLTDEDLQYEEGKKEEMLNKIQVKLGKTKEEMATTVLTL